MEGSRPVGDSASPDWRPSAQRGAPTVIAALQRVLRRCAAGDDTDDGGVRDARLRDALRALATACAAERAVVYLRAHDESWVCAHDWASPRSPLGLSPEVPPDEAAALSSALPAGEVRTASTTTGDRRVAVLATRLGERAVIVAPIHDGDEVAGALALAGADEASWGEAEVQLVRTVADAVWLVLGRAEAETERRRSERRARAIGEGGSEIVAVMDADGRIRQLGPAFGRVLGWEPSRWLDRPARQLVADEDRTHFDERLRDLALDASPPGNRTRLRGLRVHHADGSLRWVEGALTNLLSDVAVGGLVLNAHDVTARVRAEEALAHHTLHDPLTGLPDRALLDDRVAQALARAPREAREVVVLLAGIDGFSRVNETVGHHGGDLALIEIADRLRSSLRAADTVARVGGDEFAVVAEIDGSDEAVERLRTAVAEVFRRPVTVNSEEVVHLRASVGIARGDHSSTPEQLLGEAAGALRDAKGRDSGLEAVVDVGRRDRGLGRRELVESLHRAVDRGELRLEYQLVSDLDRGGVVGAEALVRWQRLGEGLLQPTEFVPVAEETGLIVAVGEWVLEEALRQLVAWERARPEARPLRVSVNVSGRQLVDRAFTETVAYLLEHTRVAPHQLGVEVPEQALADDPDGCRNALEQLREVGVRLVIDDFGADAISLAYLRDLPVDAVKVDRDRVARIDTDPRERAVVAAAVGVAEALGFEPQAVGVETEAQQRALSELGVRFAQGYLLHRPAPPEDVVRDLGGVSAGPSGDQDGP